MKRKRLVVLLLCSLVGIYLTTYLANSLGGGYRLLFVSTIHHRIDYEVRIDAKTNGGAIAWQPRYGNYNRFRSDALGKVFYPLILIDQTVWHRDIPASEIDSREGFQMRVAPRQVHPEDRQLYVNPPLP